MDAVTVDAVPAASDADSKWLHDLRNAVNTVTMASTLIRRSLETGATGAALELVKELENACARCGALLHDPAQRPH